MSFVVSDDKPDDLIERLDSSKHSKENSVVGEYEMGLENLSLPKKNIKDIILLAQKGRSEEEEKEVETELGIFSIFTKIY